MQCKLFYFSRSSLYLHADHTTVLLLHFESSREPWKKKPEFKKNIAAPILLLQFFK